MFDPPDLVLEMLTSAPGQWFLVAGGPYSRVRTYAPVATRIKNDDYPLLPTPSNGRFETRVLTARRTRDQRTYDAELRIRFVLTDTHTTRPVTH
jgi:hypothetical protein